MLRAVILQYRHELSYQEIADRLEVSPRMVKKYLERVLVSVYIGSPSMPTKLLPPATVQVGAGYQVEVRDQLGAPRPVDARAAVAWLKRRIVFENEPLGEVAEEFNRYGHIAIEIDDEALRSLPISGVFDAYDTDSFAAFLETLNGVVVQKTPTRIRVHSVASASREQQPVDR
jgi:transmembrane sensor